MSQPAINDTHSPWLRGPEMMTIGTMPDSDILLRFGERVRKLRKECGWSQEEFADNCGLDRTYVGGIERGERNLSLVNIARLAKALDAPISAVMRRVEGGA